MRRFKGRHFLACATVVLSLVINPLSSGHVRLAGLLSPAPALAESGWTNITGDSPVPATLGAPPSEGQDGRIYLFGGGACCNLWTIRPTSSIP